MCESSHSPSYDLFSSIKPYCLGMQRDGLSEEFNEEDTNLFGVGAFIEESSRALVIGELSLFMRLPILQVACNDPLAW
jgi:hypothetical protein